MVREQTLDLPSPSATSWDFIALQRLSNLADFVLLTQHLTADLDPSLSCPSVYSYLHVRLGAFLILLLNALFSTNHFPDW